MYRFSTLPLLAVATVVLLAGCGGDDEPTPTPDASDGSGTAEDAAPVDTQPNPSDAATGDPPSLTSVDPQSGLVGTILPATLTGSGFDGSCTAYFGEAAAVATRLVTPEILDVTIGEQSSPGVVDVEVRCAGGDATLRRAFAFEAPPSIRVDRVVPELGLTTGGDRVVVEGSGLFAGDRNLVAFGGQPGSDLTFDGSGRTIAVTTPAGTAGPVRLTVELGGEVAFVDDGFVYLEPLAVDEVRPDAGAIGGGTEVRFEGSGFGELAGITVLFGEAEADPDAFVFDDDGHGMTLVAPAADGSGFVDIEVASLLESVTIEEGFAYDRPIAVTGMRPSSILEGSNERVVLEGSGYRDDAAPLSVVVADEDAFSVSVDSADELSFVPPLLDAGTYEVRVRHGFFRATSPTPLRIVAAITVTDVAPSSGASGGGTVVTLTGTGFTERSQVLFGTSPAASTTWISETEIEATSPTGSGTVDVTVQDLPAQFTFDDGFTYTDE